MKNPSKKKKPSDADYVSNSDLYDALENYMNRERRYGMTSQQMNIENTKASQSQDSYLQRILSTFSPKS